MSYFLGLHSHKSGDGESERWSGHDGAPDSCFFHCTAPISHLHLFEGKRGTAFATCPANGRTVVIADPNGAALLASPIQAFRGEDARFRVEGGFRRWAKLHEILYVNLASNRGRFRVVVVTHRNSVGTGLPASSGLPPSRTRERAESEPSRISFHAELPTRVRRLILPAPHGRHRRRAISDDE